MNILLGVTGSVAATLTPKLVQALTDAGHEVQVVATRSSLYFWNPADLPTPSRSPSPREGEKVRVWTDTDEWPNDRYARDQPIPHIELRRWADVLLIAPCSANTLAKLATGQCDNLLTSIARAWDRTKLVILAPAMNTMMWEHPATAEHLATLTRWYPKLTVVAPIAKTLACGDVGLGALASIDTIVDAIS